MRIIYYGLVVSLLVSTAPVFALEADINGDGVVNLTDLAIIAGEWL